MKVAIEFKPPNKIGIKEGYKTIFLAGSIEMGEAEDWQSNIREGLSNEKIIFYNPRRDDWDNSWEQNKGDVNFRGQVEWELNALESCDLIVMYLDPNTKSPISLLELGLFANSNKLIVCCPEGFFRKGNVDIVCEKYEITQVDTLTKLIEKIRG